MLRFAAAALGAQGSPPAVVAAFAEAERPRRDLPALGKMRIGLNWITANTGPVEIVWHNGGTAGYRSNLGLDKSRQRAVVVLTNSGNGVDDIGRHLLDPSLPLLASASRRESRLAETTGSEGETLSNRRRQTARRGEHRRAIEMRVSQ